jgi:hypothetical protein
MRRLSAFSSRKRFLLPQAHCGPEEAELVLLFRDLANCAEILAAEGGIANHPVDGAAMFTLEH